MTTSGTDTLNKASLQALLGPPLTAEQAAMIFEQGQEAVVFALLGRAKPNAARPGHPGHRRPTPPRIDCREEHTLTAFPKCNGSVSTIGPRVVALSAWLHDLLGTTLA